MKLACHHPVFGLSTVLGETAAVPQRQVRAHFTETSVFVYQAFRPEIAIPSVREQRFVQPFSRTRMTWIKPSFAWMMYRSGWGVKDGQEHILRVEVSRRGFELALSRSCLSHFDPSIHSDRETWNLAVKECPVRVQWDPERTLLLEILPWRTVQIGIGPDVIGMYVDKWVLSIEDFSKTALEAHKAVRSRDIAAIEEMLPLESTYPLPREIARRIS